MIADLPDCSAGPIVVCCPPTTPRSCMAILESDPQTDWRAAARAALDERTRAGGSLGRLEEVAQRLCELQRTLTPSVERPRVLVFAGDHGVAAEGVSVHAQSATGQMVGSLAAGGAAACVLARCAGADLEAVDVGVATDLDGAGIVHARVRPGTGNFLHGAAMAAEELDAAMEVGRAAVRRAAGQWVDAVGLGAAGVGGSTAAAALLSALTRIPATRTVGAGSGVAGATLEHKRRVVERALFRHADALADPRTALAALGGLEMAAIAGAALEAPRHGLAVVVDGFVSTVAVLAAERMDPAIAGHPFFAHRAAEGGHGAALEAVGGRPLLDLEIRLGEGVGAALALPLLRAAACLMRATPGGRDG